LQAEDLQEAKRNLRNEVSALVEQVQSRDQEISRLHNSYRGGQTFSNLKDDFDNKLEMENR